MTKNKQGFVGPTLYKKNAQGGIEQWTIQSVGNAVVTTYGEHNGKLITSKYVVDEGKNLGKINETNPISQAAAEAKAKWTKKLKDGYVPSFINATRGLVDTSVITGGIVPMRHKTFKNDKKKIKWPALGQPKLNGEHCVVMKKDGVVTMWTRTRKPIHSCPHIIDDLDFILANFDEIILNGELYNHELNCEGIGKAFEKLMSAIRKQKPSEESILAELHLFDLVNDEDAFTRNKQLRAMSPLFDYTSVKFVETFLIKDEKTMMKYHRSNVKRKYEGTVVRNVKGKYVSKRSFDIQKLKDFEDAEFKIVGFVKGKQDTVVAKCVDKKGSFFSATMEGDKQDNQKYLKNKSYIGKMLKVQFQGLTGKNQVPLFPVGLEIRES